MKSLVRLCFAHAAVVACTLALNGSFVAMAEDGDDATQPSDVSQIQKFSSEELHTLVAPVALYPDALLAQILPASAFPIQVVEAYRYLQSSPKSENPPDNTTWDSSVIALLHYPSVLKKLNDDPTWTDQLGVAATYQLSDVMQAIQQVRAEAQAVGNLQSNDKQIVQADQGVIEIQPADPLYIYVPEYDPVYICDRRLDNPFIWGSACVFGIWLGNRWDWRDHRLWFGNSWRGGRWYRGTPTYWRPPNRPIPSWYLRNGARRSGPALPGRDGYAGGTVRTDRVHPIISSHLHTPPNNAQKGVTQPVHSLIGGEDAANRAHQTIIESNRGRVSREKPVVHEPVVHEPVVHQPVVREPVVRQPVVREPVVRTPVQPRVVERQPMHEEFNHQSDRGTASRESSRGSSSRGKR